jgi:hypothetical protein
MQKSVSTGLVLGLALIVAACDGGTPTTAAAPSDPAPASIVKFSTSTEHAKHRAVLGLAETITDPLSGEAGRVVWLRKDLGNGQLTHDFVYGDPRRATFNGGEPGITYAVNTGFPSADANLTDQVGWLHQSVGIWDAEACADLTLSENAVPAGQRGVVETFFSTGVLPENWKADITQVGFFGVGPLFAAGSSTLGVTYTLFWEDENGDLTDIDGNGKLDVAFREIYYNDQYNWSDNGVEGTVGGVRWIDFPAVAIHEVGHGFSAGHFGSIGRKDGFLFPQPRAVMNAIYGGPLRGLLGHDVGAHCNNWSQWPNN